MTKRQELAKEEMYDKMMNPHLYGSGDVNISGGGSYRRVKPGEHYEEVQRKELENEIRIRERREKYKREEERRNFRSGGYGPRSEPYPPYNHSRSGYRDREEYHHYDKRHYQGQRERSFRR